VNDGFIRAMRLAPPILVVIGILAVISSAVSAVLLLREMAEHGNATGLSYGSQVAAVIVAALDHLTFPLFGAGLLWRADRWLRSRREIAQ
jgi:hypothetical protein